MEDTPASRSGIAREALQMTERQNLRIALLEDSEEQAARVGEWIETKGYHCGAFSTAEDFQRAFRKTSYDVVVLDWTLETGSSGLEVLHWIRRTLTSDVPVIFVTSRQAEEDIVKALRAGADDYLAKPVRQHELLARLYALARRAQPETEILDCPPYTFDTSAREVRMDGEPVKLTEKEYELALFLFRNRGRVLSPPASPDDGLGHVGRAQHAHRRHAREPPPQEAPTARLRALEADVDLSARLPARGALGTALNARSGIASVGT